jgi:dihydroneopterin aldolase
MSTISLHNIRLKAFHGCLPEETVIGGNYQVDVRIKTDLTDAAHKDDLNRTVDYCQVYDIVKREMAIPSKLLENVAQRIVNALMHELRRINAVKVRVSKIAPPVNGDVEMVSVTISGNRKVKDHSTHKN